MLSYVILIPGELEKLQKDAFAGSLSTYQQRKVSKINGNIRKLANVRNSEIHIVPSSLRRSCDGTSDVLF
jgi:CRISPR/Cas system-associated endoribonuclease Cas2